VVSFLLPEHIENISLNLDFLGNLNKDNILRMLRQQLTPAVVAPPQPTTTPQNSSKPKELVLNVSNSMLIDRRIRMSGDRVPGPPQVNLNHNYHLHHQYYQHPGLANDLINVINAKNFARNGKLNPLYAADEERASQ
jgi:hypothetical protein